MSIKINIICLIVLICALAQSKVNSASISNDKVVFQTILQTLFGGAGSDSSSDANTTLEPDWNNLDYKEINLDTEEKAMKPSEMYAKIEECVKKCLENNSVNPNHSLRDNCIAKNCDIY